MRSYRLTRRAGRLSPPLVLERLEDRVVPGFLAPLAFDAGQTVGSIVAGDFTGSGRLDVAVSGLNYRGSTVSVLLGNGDGSFQPARTYPTGTGSVFVAEGDFNGDGILDLAVAGGVGTNKVSVLLGNGDGSFQAPRLFSAGNNPTAVAVGDFTGSGHRDLAVANYDDNTVSVLVGNGDGSFQPARNFTVGTAPDSLAVGHFTGSGHRDLAVANYADNTVSVLVGNGDGNFQPARNFSVGYHPVSVAVGDLRGNGTSDLVVGDTTYQYQPSQLSILLGNGDGTFQDAQNITVGGHPYSVTVTDLNGDGHPDLVVAGGGLFGGMAVLLGNGDGTFGAPQQFNTGYGAVSVVAGNFADSGHLDLALANSDGNVSVLVGNGDGTLQVAPSYPYAGGDPAIYATHSVVVGDFAGNGIADLAVGSASGGSNAVSVFMGNGDGTFQPAQNYALGGEPIKVVAADFNGDGNLDLAVLNIRASGWAVSVLLGNGDGSFQPPLNYAVDRFTNNMAVGDFGGDGLPDIVVYGGQVGTFAVRVLLGNGDGTFQPGPVFRIGGAPIVTGDFTGAGHVDIIAGNYLIQGNGDDTFQPPRALGNIGFGAQVTGDFAGNGHLGFAAVEGYNGSRVSVVLGNGDGTFQAPQYYNVGAGPTSVAVDDFNSDGIPDLAIAGFGGVRVLLGNGDGTFRVQRVGYLAGFVPASVAAGEFDGDGYPDLAVANGLADGGSQNVSILLNDGAWPGGGAPGAHRPPGAGRSNRALPIPAASPAAPGLSVAEWVRFYPNSGATPPPSGSTPTLGNGQLLSAAGVDNSWTRVPASVVSALAPAEHTWIPTRTLRTTQRLVDHLFAAAPSGWLWDESAGA
jgi:hypothetical protein